MLWLTIQGIPENLQQETRPLAPSHTSPTPAATNPEGGDESVNLFEAAAQAGAGGRSTAAARGGAGAGGDLFGGAGAAGAGAGAGTGGAPGSGLGNLDFLRNNPQFQQLRQVVQQNPQMLEPILQQVGAGNPQLAALIGQHPEQFLQLLSEDGDNDAPLPPGAQAISVTEEEREAIERVSNQHIIALPF
jgi:UV excision repair protein RAD23